MIEKCVFWLKGDVRARIKGVYGEKIINAAKNKGCALRNIKRLDLESLELETDIGGYKKLRGICRKNKCKIKIVKKTGLPFKISPYRHRYGIFLGILSFFIGIYMLSTRVWSFSITDDGMVDKNKIMEIVASYGIRAGSVKSKIDVKGIRSDIMQKYEDFTFFNINFYGSHAEIVTKGREKKQNVIPKDMACDIICDKDGLIERIIVKEGTKLKERGETVIKGDRLVSNKLMRADGSFTRVGQ